MADFFSGGWSLYVGGLTLSSLLACLWLLLAASRRRVMAADNTTGHVWDEDLRELNNPLPRWWMGLFVMTVVFAVLYLVLYPGLGSNEGRLGWSSQGQWEAEQVKSHAEMAPLYAGVATRSAAELAADPKAMGIGERLFVNNCSGCHGSDARGSKGFPNLTDRDWLGGDGGIDYIAGTIAKGRQGVMPPMAAAVGTPEDVRNVANYVLSLSGSAHNQIAAQVGKARFGVCAACHGADGKGNPTLGAPNLTDKVWLHGWGEAAIIHIVNNGKVNAMPPQAGRLSPEQIRVLAAWVWGLSQPGTLPAATASP